MFAALRSCLLGALCALGLATGAQAQLSGLSRAEDAGTSLTTSGQEIALTLQLSQPVPWRIRYLAQPPRVVLDFREVDFSALDLTALASGAKGRVLAVQAGPVRDGWTRMTLTLDSPYLTRRAEMKTGLDGAGRSQLALVIGQAEADAFAIEAARADSPAWALPQPADLAPPRAPRGVGPLVVVLDPGHGGVDPGAERDGHSEAKLMLTFARELKDAIVRAGVAEVVLTRDSDAFVPLEARIALAHAADADLFLSIHADAVPEGIATGATIYTMSEDASDAADAALAERHDRDALMSGVDLKGQDDMIAGVLMDMARLETAPRTEKLAQALIASIRKVNLPLHKVPHRKAAFSVLKAPDIPSALIEVGYMSSPRDLQRLLDKDARAQMIGAIVEGISLWAIEDAATGALLRQ